MSFSYRYHPSAYSQLPDNMAATVSTSGSSRTSCSTSTSSYGSANSRSSRNASSSIADAILIRQELERRGRCPDCGITQTHRIQYKRGRGDSASATIVHREPLTIEKQVYQGRCLLCCSPPRYSYPAPDSGSSSCRGGNNDSSSTCNNGALALAHDAASAASTNNSSSNGRRQHLGAISEDPTLQLQQEHSVSFHTAEIAHNDSDSTSSSSDNNSNHEIFQLLSRIMHRHPHNLQTHISSFHTLWVLSWETDNARSIGHVGGIPILLKSLRYHLTTFLNIANRYNRNCNHASSPSSLTQMQLQANGLATLQNLSVTKLNKDLLVQNDGISHILLVMSTFCENKDIQFSGCNALANILSNAPCYKGLVLQQGGLEIVLKSVEVHKDNEGVCRGAYKCLSLLGDDQKMNTNHGHSSRRSSTSNTLSRRRQRKSRRMKDGDVTSDEESHHSSRHGRGSSSEDDNGTVGQQQVQRVNSMDMDGSARSAVSSRSAMSLTP